MNVNASASAKRKQSVMTSDSDGDSDIEEIVCPVQNLCRIIASDSEEESESIDGEINFTCDEWLWENKENETKICEFSRVPGLNIELGEGITALQVLNHFISEDFWNNIVIETNRYGSQITGDGNRKSKQFEEKWRDTNKDEIHAYFALCIVMALVKKQSIQLYWSKKRIIETPVFQKTMTLRRFSQLSRFFNFSSNDVRDEGDPLCKLQGVIEHLNEKFSSVYTPDEYVALEESHMKYTDGISCEQFNKPKRARIKVKFYKLCESKSGYCLRFKMHTSQHPVRNSAASVSENVALSMCTPLANFGHTLFTDDWCSSPNLFRKLQALEINAIGRVRWNRKNMPKELAAMQLKKSDHVSRSCKGILAARWKHNKDTYLLSTKHRKIEMVKIDKKNSKTKTTATKPNIVLEYNDGMGGVYLQHCQLSPFLPMRSYIESYKKIFFYLMDITLFNAYILFTKVVNLPRSKKYSYSKFRLDVAEQILESVCLPVYKKRGRQCAGDTLLRLQAKQWGHFPRNIPPTEAKKNPQRRCKVCAKHRKRSETTWECKECLVALHVPKCFEIYHTQVDY